MALERWAVEFCMYAMRRRPEPPVPWQLPNSFQTKWKKISNFKPAFKFVVWLTDVMSLWILKNKPIYKLFRHFILRSAAIAQYFFRIHVYTGFNIRCVRFVRTSSSTIFTIYEQIKNIFSRYKICCFVSLTLPCKV